MHIYTVVRTDDVGWDEHDGFVAVADSIEDARSMRPSTDDDGTWVTDTASLVVKEIGEANEDMPRGVFFTSFNAG